MGVRTKVFGPFAWLVFEGVARFFDEFMEHETDEVAKEDMLCFMKEFIFLIGFVLPCIYCRISYQGFTDPDNPDNKDTDLHHMLMLKQGAQRLVYNLHCRVSRKLRDQEREQCQEKEDRKAMKECNRKWKEHHISFRQALQTKFPSASSKRFWNAMVVFLALVMCDFRPDESCYIFRFFWVIGKMLVRAHSKTTRRLANVYMYALEQTLPLWKYEMPLSERIDIVWVLKKHVFTAGKWTFNHTRQSFEQKCKSAIVGCLAKTPFEHEEKKS